MSKKIIAVTACPTGIAHTFMAAESLSKAAKELGVEIKVEKNGSGGIRDPLSNKDIQECIGVIVAADVVVDIERFNGKPVLQTSVSEGIKKPHELINKLLDNKVPVKQGTLKAGNDVNSGAGVGQTIYKHLMSGVSHMLPFVVAGGILIAMSFLWGIFSADPKSSEYNEFAAMLMKIGQQAFGIMVPVFTAYIAYSIAGRPGLVAGFVGGLLANVTGSGFLGGIIAGFAAGYLMLYINKWLSFLPSQYEGLKSIFLLPLIGVFTIGALMIGLGTPVSAINQGVMSWLGSLQSANPILLGIVVGMFAAFDFGGPVNKAVYVTGTVLLAQGNYYFMAGVSAACITPPLVIALATTLFRKAFTEEERAAGVVNYILGCTHITEGAIPFAAKDPLRVIPIMMLASAISAVLSYVAHITVPAPHGGFLILPLVNHAILWVGCILVGSLVGAVIYGMYRTKVLKKTLQNEHSMESSELISHEVFKISADDIIINDDLNKDDALATLSTVFREKQYVSDDYFGALKEREAQGNTYLDNGIAIPHGTLDKKVLVKKTGVVVLFNKDGILWNGLNKAKIIVGIAAKGEEHIDVLKQLSLALSDDKLNEKLEHASSKEDILKILNNEHYDIKEHVPLDKNDYSSVEIKLNTNNGLHARPASSLAKYAKTFENEIFITNLKSNVKVSAKSMMKLLTLGIKDKDMIKIEVFGSKHDIVAEQISNFIKNNLDN